MRKGIPSVIGALLFLVAIPAAGIDGRATPKCGGQPATRVGTNGDNIITGTHFQDVIVAMGGDDVIYGKGGPDLICAGAGNDTVFAGAGTNRIWGGSGNDVIKGGANFDTMYGGPGDDVLKPVGGHAARLYGGDGRDRFVVRMGTDIVVGGGKGRDTLDMRLALARPTVRLHWNTIHFDTHQVGTVYKIERILGTEKYQDVLYGNAADNVIKGYGNNDLLYGRDGDDVLWGGTGWDGLFGENGDDELHGGTDPGGGDKDQLDGGPGNNGCSGGEQVQNCDYTIYFP